MVLGTYVSRVAEVTGCITCNACDSRCDEGCVDWSWACMCPGLQRSPVALPATLVILDAMRGVLIVLASWLLAAMRFWDGLLALR